MTRRIVVLLLLLLSMAGCGGSAETPDGTVAADEIDFTAETVGGGKIDMAEYAGKPLALWFWSPW